MCINKGHYYNYYYYYYYSKGYHLSTIKTWKVMWKSTKIVNIGKTKPFVDQVTKTSLHFRSYYLFKQIVFQQRHCFDITVKNWNSLNAESISIAKNRHFKLLRHGLKLDKAQCVLPEKSEISRQNTHCLCRLKIVTQLISGLVLHTFHNRILKMTRYRYTQGLFILYYYSHHALLNRQLYFNHQRMSA